MTSPKRSIQLSLIVAAILLLGFRPLPAQQPAPLREGAHKLTLQWITDGSVRAGSAQVTKAADGSYTVKGEQTADSKGSLSIDGSFTVLSPTVLLFTGKIDTRCSFLYAGEVCSKTGTYHFAIRGGRKFWRLQEMKNCDGESVDYVDLYF